MPCRNHSYIEEGLEHCEICTETYCADCLVDFQDKRTCGECKAQVVADLEGGLGLGGEGELPPWERRQQLGLVAAFWETTKRVISKPAEFFATVDKRAERWDALVYVIVVQLLASIASWAYMALIFGVIFTAAAQEDEAFRQLFGGMFGVGMQGIFQVIIAPVGAVLGALIGSSLIHLFLIVTKTATRPWHQTMRHYCYAQAPAVIAVLPLPWISAVVGSVWAVIATVMMTRRVHGTTTGTAVAAVLWPVVLGACCFAFVFGMIGLVAAFSQGG